MKTARSEGLVLCLDCQLLVRQPRTGAGACPRCGSALHGRIRHSISHTWAFVVAAWVLLLPANLYPIMTVVYFGEGEPDTIVSGVIKLAEEGMIPIAIVVFIASVAVPMLKLLGIMLLLFTVHFKWSLSKTECTVLYRIIEVIGAWSMLDLFMISILVTLVDLGTVAQISAGPGATAFASVVVLTMFAAMSFDPRLLWDLQEEPND
ncbi:MULTISPECIES: paraquat-inducible protein A [unclassified Ketobacter]|uniref:paraquat-inducible protein A n=1 Tax=unclassified Ketobacter TaxID=2639109 RepID=UPI000F208AEC|nr:MULTISPECIES: paraquat-inducible protein A [unclassified Ketobacter]RLT90650.1 MAG: paraquat-inducible membrane protein A [Ketobacter sp. GenoA1]RLT99748.1 MAG: paraquat-inducible membrane protein A [Ketobacter sp.]